MPSISVDETGRDVDYLMAALKLAPDARWPAAVSRPRAAAGHLESEGRWLRLLAQEGRDASPAIRMVWLAKLGGAASSLSWIAKRPVAALPPGVADVCFDWLLAPPDPNLPEPPVVERLARGPGQGSLPAALRRAVARGDRKTALSRLAAIRRKMGSGSHVFLDALHLCKDWRGILGHRHGAPVDPSLAFDSLLAIGRPSQAVQLLRRSGNPALIREKSVLLALFLGRFELLLQWLPKDNLKHASLSATFLAQEGRLEEAAERLTDLAFVAAAATGLRALSPTC